MITIILAMGLLLHDAYGPFVGFAQDSSITALAVLILPKLFFLFLYQRLCTKALERPTTRRLKRLDRLGTILKNLLLASYALDLAGGCLNWIRASIGDWILLDELLVLLPTLVTQLLLWRLYYPVDRKLREAMAFAAIDSDEPVTPVWTLRQYMLAQVRHSLLIPGVPLLILLGWTEALNLAPERWMTLPNGFELYSWLSLGGTFAVFLFTPVMIRWLWDTQALPGSPLRSKLLNLCKQYRVGVREILYWKTFGGMANGAVIGFVSPMRYILLTDVLLSQMGPTSIEAVMAHEIAHIRKKHMFWMIAGAGAMMVLLQLFFGIGLWYLGTQLANQFADPQSWQESIDMVTTLLGIACAGGVWLLGFGWLSRRMERQADSFAAAHMAKINGHQRIEPEDAYAMIQALSDVARLNHVRPDRKSWRHGSIAWRQANLQSLVNEKATRLPIDRTMRWLCALIVIGVVLASWLINGGADKLHDSLAPIRTPKVYVI
jgi:Zn-dependent protease with chaperone function